MTMIALGGVIGAGLFVGSGVVIRSAGPATRHLLPADRLPGRAGDPHAGASWRPPCPPPARSTSMRGWRWATCAGFVTGWMYWYFWVGVVAFEAIAGADLIRFWLPAVPAMAAGARPAADHDRRPTCGRSAPTASSSSGSPRSRWARSSSSWWSATLYVAGLWFGTGPHIANLTAHGGFAPRGWLPIFTGAVAATGFYFGAEIVTVASAEFGRARGGGGAGHQLGDLAGC